MEICQEIKKMHKKLQHILHQNDYNCP